MNEHAFDALAVGQLQKQLMGVVGCAKMAHTTKLAHLPPRCSYSRPMIDTLRAAAEALNNGDPEPFAALFAEGAEWRSVSHGHLWWKRTPV